MTPQVSGMLADALDALGLAEIGVREVVADTSAETNETDRGLMAALEHIAIASTRIATRRVVYERKEAKDKRAEDEAIQATRHIPPPDERTRNYRPVYGGALATIPDEPESERVTVRELARELDVSDSQMHRWVRDGRIGTYKAPGVRARIIKSEDVHLLRSVAATKPAGRTAAPWIGKALDRAGR